jgi:hypothetical protein
LRRSSAIRNLAIHLTLVLFLALGSASPASAAEVFQVQDGDHLLIGDRNRVYSVVLACLRIAPDREEDAQAWLRRILPRHTRVNLRPIGQRDGLLLARVQRLDTAMDVSEGLIAAGLAQAIPCAGADPAGP